MSESLRNDGRVWVPKNKDDKRKPQDIPEEERDYYLERIYPSFGNLVPRDVASRNAKAQVDEGKVLEKRVLQFTSISKTQLKEMVKMLLKHVMVTCLKCTNELLMTILT